MLGTGAGFPRRQRLVGDEPVSQNLRIQIQDAADTEIETVLIAAMRPVAHHEPASHGVDDPGSRSHGQKWSPTPSLLIPAIDPEVNFGHRANQVVAFVVDTYDAVGDGNGFDSPRAEIMSPSQTEPKSHVLKERWVWRVFRYGLVLATVEGR